MNDELTESLLEICQIPDGLEKAKWLSIYLYGREFELYPTGKTFQDQVADGTISQ